MSILFAIHLCGMIVTFCLMWPERDAIILSVALLFGLEEERDIARAGAALLAWATLCWPWTLKALMEEKWPDP